MKNAGEDTLTREEHTRMRRMIHAYMEMKPLRRAVSSPTHVAAFQWIFSYRPVAAVLVLGLFISSGGISYAAESALPGDILYAVKTNVNEPIKGALALSASAKTEWAMAVAGKRIEEAATLAAEGRLDPSTQEALQANFEEHATLAEDNIEKDAGTDPNAGAETATRFGARLSEYQRVLTDVADAKNVETSSLTASIESHNSRLTRIRTKADDSATLAMTSDDAISASRMRIAAKEGFGISSDLARSASAAFAPSSVRTISIQLDDASATISEGEELLKQDSAPRARSSFKNALIASEKLGVFLRMSSAIHKRTGLVIGEPGRGESSNIASVRSGESATDVSGGNEMTQDNLVPVQAALMNTSSAPTENAGDVRTSTEIMQTTVTTPQSTRGQEGEGQKSGKDSRGSDSEHDEENGHSGPSEPEILPLPAPTSILR